jgi:aldehyde dehydrogenase (NAD+)
MQNKLFVGGEFVDAVEGATLEVRNPHDGALLTEIAEGRAADIDRAVDAAAAAQPAWARLQASERGRLLLKLADASRPRAQLCEGRRRRRRRDSVRRQGARP